MSKNITYFSKEECNFENLIYILCKGNQKEIDLLYFQMKNYEPVYGILSMEWAFMADIDIESEGFSLFFHFFLLIFFNFLIHIHLSKFFYLKGYFASVILKNLI